MRIGFTGTRAGMSAAQDEQLAWLLHFVFGRLSTNVRPQFHHGACVGADLEAATIAAGLERFDVISHPAERGKELLRDREMVRIVSVMIAAPLTDQEQLRSGTWATVRYTRQAGKPVIMLSR